MPEFVLCCIPLRLFSCSLLRIGSLPRSAYLAMELNPAWPPDSVCQIINDPKYLPLTPSELTALQDTMAVLNIVSLLANVFTIVTYLLFKRAFPRNMPMYFALAGAGLQVFLLIGAFAGPKTLCQYPILCKIQGT